MTDTNDPLPGLSDTISESALERARKGDDLAFKRICLLYSRLVYSWCRKANLGPEDSEDVSQNVFLAVSRSLSTFQRSAPGDSFRGWIRTITRNKISDFFREKFAAPEICGGNVDTALIAAIDSCDSNEASEEKKLLYEKAVDLIQSEFSASDCEAFMHSYVYGLTSKEVARRLNISVNSVYIARSRILKRLRDEFCGVLADL